MTSLKMFELTIDDSLPSLEYQAIREDGTTAVDLSGHTGYFKTRGVDASTNSFTLTVTSSGGSGGQITSTSSGVVRFDWSTDSWGSSGSYYGEISFDSSGGKTETAITRQPIVVRSGF